MNEAERERLRFLEADANIHLMNGDLDAALRGFREMEHFALQVGDTGKAREARLSMEAIEKRSGQG